ncbi:MAG: endonuclease III [Candidatus Eisenbacteria bacterium]|nr:endonuclease III [Candidatus Eisenbacteria bacterium]
MTAPADRHPPARSTPHTQRQRAARLARRLARLYPEARTALVYDSPFQLYVATVLSAQCTDARVNQVTPELFRRYPTAEKIARARRSSIEALIRRTGFFRNKTRSIQEGARRIVRAYGGALPGEMEALLTIPGIGRKTANVILGNAFGIPGIAVDTHVRRLSQRLGLTRRQDPVRIEFELMELYPPRQWIDLSHRLILHGRQICHARRPRCGICSLRPDCPHGQQSEAA